MNIEDMHKNLRKALLEDQKYKQVIESIEDEKEKEILSNYAERLMEYFQENIFSPLVEKVDNDPEFRDALSKKMDKLIPNKKE